MSKPAEVIKSYARRGDEGYSQTEALMAALELVSINAELLEALGAMLDAFDIGQRASSTSAIGKARRVYRKAKGE